MNLDVCVIIFYIKKKKIECFGKIQKIPFTRDMPYRSRHRVLLEKRKEEKEEKTDRSITVVKEILLREEENTGWTAL